MFSVASTQDVAVFIFLCDLGDCAVIKSENPETPKIKVLPSKAVNLIGLVTLVKKPAWFG